MTKPNLQIERVRIDPQRAAALHAALGLNEDAPSVGAPLPHFWHWAQFWTISAPCDLGRDGHPKVGGFIPDLGLPRRMWAGGSLDFSKPLLIGEDAERTSQVIDIKQKEGRTGPLAFVTIEHVISAGGEVCITERQDLVYREDPDRNAPSPAGKRAPTDENKSEVHSVSTTDLFRYSALTFNGHRIHYDLDYARDVEGYPGLVTHGPLLAQWMIAFAERELGTVKRFSFRAIAPVFHFETVAVCLKRNAKGLSLWVKGPDGRLAMTGEAQ